MKATYAWRAKALRKSGTTGRVEQAYEVVAVGEAVAIVVHAVTAVGLTEATAAAAAATAGGAKRVE
jgi:hypothetical protein